MPTVYAGMRDALLVARGAPENWHTSTALEGHDLECVAAHPDRPERAFVGTSDDGLHRTTDGGASFERVGRSGIAEHAYREARGDPLQMVTSVTVDPSDPDRVWAGTDPSRAFVSEDGGDSWAPRPGLVDLPSADRWSFPPRPDTHHVRTIAVDPGDSERVYLGIEAGALVRTADGGETWIDHPPGARRDNHTLAVHPDEPGWVWSAAGDGFATSTDGGDTWAERTDGLEHGYCWSVAVDPGTPTRIVCSAASGATAAHRRGESYVYHRAAATRWRRAEDFPNGEGLFRPVLAAGRVDGEVYALCNRGLFRSGDAGHAWRRQDIGWPDRFGGQTARGLAVV